MNKSIIVFLIGILITSALALIVFAAIAANSLLALVLGVVVVGLISIGLAAVGVNLFSRWTTITWLATYNAQHAQAAPDQE